VPQLVQVISDTGVYALLSPNLYCSVRRFGEAAPLKAQTTAHPEEVRDPPGLAAKALSASLCLLLLYTLAANVLLSKTLQTKTEKLEDRSASG
jgi:hypothetical protein